MGRHRRPEMTEPANQFDAARFKSTLVRVLLFYIALGALVFVVRYSVFAVPYLLTIYPHYFIIIAQTLFIIIITPILVTERGSWITYISAGIFIIMFSNIYIRLSNPTYHSEYSGTIYFADGKPTSATYIDIARSIAIDGLTFLFSIGASFARRVKR